MTLIPEPAATPAIPAAPIPLAFDPDRKSSRWRSGWRRALRRLVLIAGVLGALTVPWLYLEYRYWDHASVPEGAASATVILPDRSTAELQPRSDIRYLKNMRSGSGRYRREVYLTGSATFTATPHATSYFEVNTSSARIVALGRTRFSVVERATVTEVYVEEGRVTAQPLKASGEIEPAMQVVKAGQGAVVALQ